MKMEDGMSPSSNIQEEQFATILMELAMQYAHLTQAQTFLLIETASSRRYGIVKFITRVYSMWDGAFSDANLYPFKLGTPAESI